MMVDDKYKQEHAVSSYMSLFTPFMHFHFSAVFLFSLIFCVNHAIMLEMVAQGHEKNINIDHALHLDLRNNIGVKKLETRRELKKY
mmetsp:Transcript_18113/g.27422  ORF Transcript_18113/g.27422 Transcript_18113/m.27422 type:complete len:86 (-) Transcript_18113:183-440(-)